MNLNLLKKILGRQEKDDSFLSPAEAIAAIAVAAIIADNLLVDTEKERLLFLLSEIKLFKNYSQQRMNAMLNKLLERVTRKGTATTIREATEVLPLEWRTTAFAIATDLVWADGVFNFREKEFLNDLHQVLEIQEKRAS